MVAGYHRTISMVEKSWKQQILETTTNWTNIKPQLAWESTKLFGGQKDPLLAQLGAFLDTLLKRWRRAAEVTPFASIASQAHDVQQILSLIDSCFTSMGQMRLPRQNSMFYGLVAVPSTCSSLHQTSRPSSRSVLATELFHAGLRAERSENEKWRMQHLCA